MAVAVSRLPVQQKPSAILKSVLPPVSNSSNISETQPSTPQDQNTSQVPQKPVVTQQQVSTTSSSSSNVIIQQQSVQQVPHNLAHGVAEPQAMAVAPSGPATVPLVEVKKEVGFDEVVLATQSAPTGATHLQTDTKDFLAAKEELMDGTIDDKTGKCVLLM